MWTGYFLIARLLRSYPISNPRPLSNSNNPINHEDSDCTDEIKTSLPSVPNAKGEGRRARAILDVKDNAWNFIMPIKTQGRPAVLLDRLVRGFVCGPIKCLGNRQWTRINANQWPVARVREQQPKSISCGQGPSRNQQPDHSRPFAVEVPRTAELSDRRWRRAQAVSDDVHKSSDVKSETLGGGSSPALGWVRLV